jgi:tetratricopeptide (TPR) repeat protein
MVTVNLLTRNNQSTIQATLESLIGVDCKIIVGDYSSTDGTVEICKQAGADIYKINGSQRHVARNKLMALSTGNQFSMEPWEILVKGHEALSAFNKKCGYVSIIQNKTLTHDIRISDGSLQFINPIFERLNTDQGENTAIILTSQGLIDSEALKIIEQWKTESPLRSEPYYYHACILLSQGKYDEFIKVADQYLFMDKSRSMSVIMIRYYYAMVQIMQKHAYKPALQNLNLCLCEKPLMAEFWCLTGDVYYHLLHRFKEAKEFYENALILGSRRLRNDHWPMDISKYKTYPNKMIDSCKAILDHKDIYIQTSL